MSENSSPSEQSVVQRQAEDATQAANDARTERVDPDGGIPGNTADPEAQDSSGDAMYGQGQSDQA